MRCRITILPESIKANYPQNFTTVIEPWVIQHWGRHLADYLIRTYAHRNGVVIYYVDKIRWK